MISQETPVFPERCPLCGGPKDHRAQLCMSCYRDPDVVSEVKEVIRMHQAQAKWDAGRKKRLAQWGLTA